MDSNGKRLLFSSEYMDDDLIRWDPLTGVYSRYYLEHAFYRTGEIAGVVMMDVDHFKSINDTCSHPAGVLALQAISGAISSWARETDTVIRCGGNEFCCWVI